MRPFPNVPFSMPTWSSDNLCSLNVEVEGPINHMIVLAHKIMLQPIIPQSCEWTFVAWCTGYHCPKSSIGYVQMTPPVQIARPPSLPCFGYISPVGNLLILHENVMLIICELRLWTVTRMYNKVIQFACWFKLKEQCNLEVWSRVVTPRDLSNSKTM